MSYQIFERDFIERTLTIIKQYERHVPKLEQFEVTLLINCLLGLLVLPNERIYARVPDVPIEQLKNWGLKADYVIIGQGLTGKEIIRRMRNSVAHFGFKALGDNGKITNLEFEDQGGNFKVVIPVESLRVFVQKLAQSAATDSSSPEQRT